MRTPIKIRFNTNAGESPLKWRVIINGVEHLAENVVIHGKVETTCDKIGEETKYHISCMARKVVWDGKVCLINAK